jgi:DNA-binding XRE family transcriptional regulator
MIKTQGEYQRLKAQLTGERERLAQQRQILSEAGLAGRKLEAAMAPLKSFAAQLEAEVTFYERIIEGDFSLLSDLNSIGRLLIALRITRGMSQAELAKRLGLSPSQVSRDERDEYYGATLEKIQKVFDVLGFKGDVHVSPKEEQGELALV